jgi:magnesium chelatase family protein
MPALVGGGARAKPGEISLAHRGVLFLDEWPEFPRPALEALRQPMETGRTTISRVHAHVTYPARFQCVAAMNPCRCGHLGDAGRECGRAPRCGEDYQGRLSGPLLDRMDLTIEVMPIPPAELARAPAGETSATVAARVQAARDAQRARFGPGGPASNAEAQINDLMPLLDQDAASLLETAATRLRLSSRGHVRALRVARSVADLAGSAGIHRTHVAEALAYRHRMPRQAALPQNA